eukprot:GHVU01201559.1.p1 GENE.GHVU01201559.1~~GHVU01201559.1.p1  ORF type:complete len:283 (+),score=39.46 GHVU01201559.1:398-1246(+)
MECGGGVVDVKGLTAVLTAVHFEKSKTEQIVNCEFSPDGLKFSAGTLAKTLLACARVPASSFRDFTYTLDAPCKEVGLPLLTLLSCLNTLHNEASLLLLFDDQESVLCLTLTEEGVETKIRVRCQMPVELPPFSAEDYAVPADEFVIRPDILRDSMLEMQEEDPSSTVGLHCEPRRTAAVNSSPGSRGDAGASPYVLTVGFRGSRSAAQWYVPYREGEVFASYDVAHRHRLTFSIANFAPLSRGFGAYGRVYIYLYVRRSSHIHAGRKGGVEGHLEGRPHAH